MPMRLLWPAAGVYLSPASNALWEDHSFDHNQPSSKDALPPTPQRQLLTQNPHLKVEPVFCLTSSPIVF